MPRQVLVLNLRNIFIAVLLSHTVKVTSRIPVVFLCSVNYKNAIKEYNSDQIATVHNKRETNNIVKKPRASLHQFRIVHNRYILT